MTSTTTPSPLVAPVPTTSLKSCVFGPAGTRTVATPATVTGWPIPLFLTPLPEILSTSMMISLSPVAYEVVAIPTLVPPRGL